MNKLALVLTVGSALLLTATAQAGSSDSPYSSNTIFFAGDVVTETCQVDINGNAESPIVMLPTVSIADLASPGATAGETAFSLGISGCSGAAIKTQTRFVGNNVDANGNLIPVDAGNSGYAGNVALQVLDAPGGNPLNLNFPALVDGVNLADGEKSGAVKYAVQYISVDGGATPGIVTGSIQYSVVYN